MGAWEIIVPETRTNFCYNPVAMGTGYFTEVGGALLERVTTYSYLGYQCFRLASAGDNAGVYFTLSTLTNAIHYMTLRVNINSDITPMFDCSLDNATYTTPTLLGQEGDWYVYGIQFPAAQANGSNKLYVLQNGVGANTIYIGHIQVELGEYPTTPITGDIGGFVSSGYYWEGIPDGSASVRLANERSGGRVYDLEDDLDLRVKYPVGSGMPPIQHHVKGMALLPGALCEGYKVAPRVLDLVSATLDRTAATVAADRKAVINYIKPDLVSPNQPVVFIYSGVNSVKPVKFIGYYDNGMEFQTTKGVIDQPVARFICYDPFAYEIPTGGVSLTAVSSVANADHIMRRNAGTWSSISTDFAASVYAMTRSPYNGLIYIAGAFTNVGDANGDYILSYNPATSTLASLSTGANNTIYAADSDAYGYIYIGGLFTDLGGVNGDRIAYWDRSSFQALSTGISSGGVYALAVAPDGKVYIGGTFTNHSDANGDYITSWDGSAWASLGTGLNGKVNDIAVAPNGDIYMVGDFTTTGGGATTLNYVAKWNGTAWSALGTGLAGGTSGICVKVDKAGVVYVGGTFTSADGVSCANIAKWNGRTFEPLGSGLSGGSAYWMEIDDNGLLYVGGSFTSAGGLTLADRMAIWNGSTWVHVDVDLPGSPTVYSILKYRDDLYVGYSTNGTATGAYRNTVTNTGSATAYPKIFIERATDGTTVTLEYIKNETTGDTLWFDYSLAKGETLVIDTTPSNQSIKSSFFGDVWRALLRGSDFSNFRLLPGTNYVSLYVNGTTVSAWMEWPITHWSADMVAA